MIMERINLEINLLDEQIGSLERQRDLWHKERNRLRYAAWCELNPDRVLNEGDKLLITKYAKNNVFRTLDGFSWRVGDVIFITSQTPYFLDTHKRKNDPVFEVQSDTDVNGTRHHSELWPLHQAWLEQELMAIE